MIAADEDRLERVRDNIDAAENEYVKYADMITETFEMLWLHYATDSCYPYFFHSSRYSSLS